MKKYKKAKTLSAIEAILEDKGLWMDTTDFDKGGDYVTIGWVIPKKGFCTIVYNAVSGTFRVYNEDRIQIAASQDERMDNVDWFVEIMDTLYEPNVEVV